MRRAAILFALAIVGCSSSKVGSSSNGIPAHNTSGPTANRVFIASLRPDFPASVTDSMLINVAHNMCNDFKNDVTYVTELAAVLKVGGIPARLAGELIASSVLVYCPSMAHVLPGH